MGDAKIDSLSEQVKKLDTKVDRIEDAINSINITLAKNTESLVYHIKRTDMLEEQVKALDTDVKEVTKHVHWVQGMFKFIVFISIGLGILASAAKVVEWLK